MSHPLESPCHKCAADIGQPCVSARGDPRRAFHRGRGSRRHIAAVAEHGHRTDSPIEHILVSHIQGWLDHHEYEGIEISTQVPIGPYRADIVVSTPYATLVVEADGAKFHNHSAAISHDKRRDRYFVIHGHAVMRFTGEEINRDPRGCAAEVGLWIRNAL